MLQVPRPLEQRRHHDQFIDNLIQPLDLSVYREHKEQLNSNAHDWYLAQVGQPLNQQEDITVERAP